LGQWPWWPRADAPKDRSVRNRLVTHTTAGRAGSLRIPLPKRPPPATFAPAARGLRAEAKDVPQWETSTLLGNFAVDDAWRQVGHRAATVSWQSGRTVPTED